MKLLGNISNFGAIDADNDDLLLNSFEDHQAFEALMAFQRFLLTGKKGSGKTAIYKKLLTNKEPDFFSLGAYVCRLSMASSYTSGAHGNS